MRAIAASVLLFEGLVLFFAILVALELTDVDHSTLWLVGGGGALLCLLLAATLRHRWGYLAGSLMQVAVIATGLVVPLMFLLGALFAGLWFFALHLGRKVTPRYCQAP